MHSNSRGAHHLAGYSGRQECALIFLPGCPTRRAWQFSLGPTPFPATPPLTTGSNPMSTTLARLHFMGGGLAHAQCSPPPASSARSMRTGSGLPPRRFFWAGVALAHAQGACWALTLGRRGRFVRHGGQLVARVWPGQVGRLVVVRKAAVGGLEPPAAAGEVGERVELRGRGQRGEGAARGGESARVPVLALPAAARRLAQLGHLPGGHQLHPVTLSVRPRHWGRAWGAGGPRRPRGSPSARPETARSG